MRKANERPPAERVSNGLSQRHMSTLFSFGIFCYDKRLKRKCVVCVLDCSGLVSAPKPLVTLSFRRRAAGKFPEAATPLNRKLWCGFNDALGH